MQTCYQLTQIKCSNVTLKLLQVICSFISQLTLFLSVANISESEEFGDQTEVSTDDPKPRPKSSDDTHRGTLVFSLSPKPKTAPCSTGCFQYHPHYAGSNIL